MDTEAPPEAPVMARLVMLTGSGAGAGAGADVSVDMASIVAAAVPATPPSKARIHFLDMVDPPISQRFPRR